MQLTAAIILIVVSLGYLFFGPSLRESKTGAVLAFAGLIVGWVIFPDDGSGTWFIRIYGALLAAAGLLILLAFTSRDWRETTPKKFFRKTEDYDKPVTALRRTVILTLLFTIAALSLWGGIDYLYTGTL